MHDNDAAAFAAALRAEFDAWRQAGRTARLWWRDDDATADSAALRRLLDIATAGAAPMALAVIPARVEESLSAALAGRAGVRVFLHGWAHINHAPRGRGLGAWELGTHRPVDDVLAELDAGRRILAERFGPVFMPVVVPPWNRIDPALFPGLAARGYAGVTLITEPVDADRLPAAFRQVRSHFDPLRWREKPARFVGWAKAAARLTDLLAERRADGGDAPVGLITHHLATEAPTWRFLETLAALVRDHPAAAWADPRDLFREPGR